MRTLDYRKAYEDLVSPEIVSLLTAVHEQKGKQKLYIEAKPEILSAMLEVAKIQSTSASNRIEGIYTSDSRFKQLIREEIEPRNRPEQEIVGYRETLKTIHENYEHIPLTASMILQLHRDLYSFTPSSIGGQWKSTENYIEEVDSDGNRRLRFKTVSAFDTPEAMEKLCAEFNEVKSKSNIDMLLVISLFVFDFLCIHPFGDGNGRMSRLLTLLLLYKEGYIVGKYISVEKIVESTKDSYYDALYDSSINWHEGENDYKAFVTYYLEIILKAYVEFEGRVEHTQNRKISKPERIRSLFNSRIGKLTKSEIATLCPDISISTIETTLRNLLENKVIIKIGAGRSTAYIKNPVE